ncbi:MAG: hypothetical protein ACFFB3_03860, partial [Candidatus Hodarchaeota archaeon]
MNKKRVLGSSFVFFFLFVLLVTVLKPLVLNTKLSFSTIQPKKATFDNSIANLERATRPKMANSVPYARSMFNHTFDALGDVWWHNLTLSSWNLFQLKANYLSGEGPPGLRLIIINMSSNQALVNRTGYPTQAWLNVTAPTAINITITATDPNMGSYPAEFQIDVIISSIVEVTTDTFISGLILFSESSFRFRVATEAATTVRLRLQLNDTSILTELRTWDSRIETQSPEILATSGEEGYVDVYRAIYPQSWLLASFSAIGDPNLFVLNCTARITFEYLKLVEAETQDLSLNFSHAEDHRLVEIHFPSNKSTLVITTESTGYLNYRLFNASFAEVTSGNYIQWNVSSLAKTFYLDISIVCGQTCNFQNYTLRIRSDPQTVNLSTSWTRIRGNFSDGWDVPKYRFYVMKGMQFKIADVSSERHELALVNSSSGAVMYDNWYVTGIFFHWKSRTAHWFFENSGYYELWLNKHAGPSPDFDIRLGLMNTTLESFPINVEGELQGFEDYDLWQINIP